ncbi:hypothetical protein [Actinophytocola oryzae]|uniref:Uncharacterized protein n=1 Tax=Actinophytocola oryzae TaxID=502181 RepID=A0A4R7UV62_9PSEU|nr:hypothetical protein [Actinophytocola oryzae]TDV40623.1 hypothetical protein CLV71_12210 [Actinophytocola oryzae]
MQIRRAAETLSCDPAALTQPQRQEIVTSLPDVKQNIFIGAKYLADIKQQTDFAFVAPSAMTDKKMSEIAVRWNAGPNWAGLGAGYGRRSLNILPYARKAPVSSVGSSWLLPTRPIYPGDGGRSAPRSPSA